MDFPRITIPMIRKRLTVLFVLFLSLCFPIQALANIATSEPLVFGAWDLVNALAWSPDGSLLAVASGTNVIVFQVSDWKRLASFDTGAFAQDLVFSSNGTWLAEASRDGKIRLWNTNKENLVTGSFDPQKTILAHKKGANSLVFDPSGAMIVSGGNDAVARSWDLQTAELTGEIIGGTYAVPSVTFQPGKNLLAVVNGHTIRLRESSNGQIWGTFLADAPLFDAAFSPDGKFLAASDTENGIQLWEVASAFRSGVDDYPGPVYRVTHSGKTGSFTALVWEIAFSPDGLLLASAGGDGSVRLWEAATGKLVQIFPGHQGGATSLAFSPDGNWLASGGLDSAVRFWKVKAP